MIVSNQSEVGRTYLPRYVLETAVRCFHLLTKGQDAAMPVSKARMCLALQSCVLSGCCLLLMALIRQLADVDRVRLSLATLSKQAEGIRAEYLCREGKAKAMSGPARGSLINLTETAVTAFFQKSARQQSRPAAQP